MCARQSKRFLIGLFVALMLAEPGFAQTATVVNGAPGQKPNEKLVMIDEAADKLAVGDQQDQKRSLIEIEMLTRAENRSDALRAQLLDVQMKEIDLQARLDDLDDRLRPENIQQAFALVGSARPMDELRDELRARLESEKGRTNAQLDLLAATQTRLEAAIREADAECARLRQRLRLLRLSDGCQDNSGSTPGDEESSSPASHR